MRRRGLLILTILMVLPAALPAQVHADWWDDFWAGYHLDRRRNEAWPQPFLHHDQYAVRAAFAPMIARGWQVEQTLTDDHFDDETQELNTAGVLKIQALLRNSPRSQQSVFVYAGFEPDITQQRLESVRNQITQWIPEERLPAIVATTLRPYGMSGQHADAINRMYADSLPPPIISTSSSSSASGSGSGSGSN